MSNFINWLRETRCYVSTITILIDCVYKILKQITIVINETDKRPINHFIVGFVI